MSADTWIHDPSAILDYTVDWSDWLGVDTIASVTWTVPAGIVKASQAETTTKATAWISGGTAATEYAVACKITTAGGRTDERTIILRCQDR